MSIGDKGICVRILEKEYRVACTKEQETALREAADYLDQQMRQIRKGGRVIGIERISVMAALNISNELLKQQRAYQDANEIVSERIRSLQEKIDEALLTNNAPEEIDSFLEALECAEEI